jgi:predicted DNA binding CopG/RHH family protein
VIFLLIAGWLHGSLETMQLPVATTTSPSSPSFAGLLAALAAPAQRPAASGDESLPAGWKSGWSDDGLEDDVATLSYERALRAHARYHNPDQPAAQNAESGQANSEDLLPAASTAVPRTATRSAIRSASDASPEVHHSLKTPYEQNLKSASITIRMSKAECAQLHRRAADAGLTVSAYLRSCTFEAESLRAMVKDTLAQLRTAKAQAKPIEQEPERQSWLRGWLARLFSPGHATPRAARA